MPEKKQEIGKKITWGNLYPRYKAGLRTGETSNMYIHTHTHTVYEYEYGYGYSLDIDTHTHTCIVSHTFWNIGSLSYCILLLTTTPARHWRPNVSTGVRGKSCLVFIGGRLPASNQKEWPPDHGISFSGLAKMSRGRVGHSPEKSCWAVELSKDEAEKLHCMGSASKRANGLRSHIWRWKDQLAVHCLAAMACLHTSWSLGVLEALCTIRTAETQTSSGFGELGRCARCESQQSSKQPKGSNFWSDAPASYPNDLHCVEVMVANGGILQGNGSSQTSSCKHRILCKSHAAWRCHRPSFKLWFARLHVDFPQLVFPPSEPETLELPKRFQCMGPASKRGNPRSRSWPGNSNLVVCGMAPMASLYKDWSLGFLEAVGAVSTAEMESPSCTGEPCWCTRCSRCTVAVGDIQSKTCFTLWCASRDVVSMASFGWRGRHRLFGTLATFGACVSSEGAPSGGFGELGRCARCESQQSSKQPKGSNFWSDAPASYTNDLHCVEVMVANGGILQGNGSSQTSSCKHRILCKSHAAWRCHRPSFKLWFARLHVDFPQLVFPPSEPETLELPKRFQCMGPASKRGNPRSRSWPGNSNLVVCGMAPMASLYKDWSLGFLEAVGAVSTAEMESPSCTGEPCWCTRCSRCTVAVGDIQSKTCFTLWCASRDVVSMASFGWRGRHRLFGTLATFGACVSSEGAPSGGFGELGRRTGSWSRQGLWSPWDRSRAWKPNGQPVGPGSCFSLLEISSWTSFHANKI